MAELSRAIARLMDERAQGAPQEGASDTPRLRDVVELVRSEVPPGERAVAEAFVRVFFARAASALETEEVTRLAMAALAAFRFVLACGAEEPRVDVFDPDLASMGWDWPGTIVHVWMRDRPFIVDTVRECMQHLGCPVRRVLDSVMSVERDASGTVLAITPPGRLGTRERLLQLQAERAPDPQQLAAELRKRLGDIVAVTEDYEPMRSRLEALIEELHGPPLPRPWDEDAEESAAFLEWLGRKNFVFLGYREYEFSGQGSQRTAAVRRGSGLGLLRDESASSCAAPAPVPDSLRRSLNEPPLLVVSKTNAQSPVHRTAHMDYVGVKEIGRGGVVVAERRFLGLFTAKAYAESSASVPILRQKLGRILALEEGTASADEQERITAVFGSLPKTEALASTTEEIHEEVRRILTEEGGTDLQVLERPDATRRGVFVVVLVPRERFSHDLPRRMQARLLRALSAETTLDERLVLDEGTHVRLHLYVVAPPAGVRAAGRDELRTHLSALLRTWDDELRAEIERRFPGEQAELLATRYLSAFPEHYKVETEAAVAAQDIARIETLRATRTLQVDVSNDAPGATERFTCIKLYLFDEELVLSDFLPVLENLGLRIFAVETTRMALPDFGRIEIDAFRVQDTAGRRLDVERVGGLLQPALRVLHAGRAESDGLNALVTSAGMTWQQADLLRTYVNHGVQIGSAPTRGALVQALVAHPHAARLMWDYFAAKFDPQRAGAPRDRSAETLPEIEKQFIASLDEVQSLAEDAILRSLFNCVAATMRTNFYRQAAAGSATAEEPRAVAVKLDCSLIPRLLGARPAHEVYVHAPHVEGVHMRGARVARGGVRRSDRPHDFRTEILDLMQTQMVKNAVIIPAGAKGGFVAKGRPGSTPSPAQSLNAYRTFIEALLDVTDNIVDGAVVPPANTLLYDDPDPYLVVAADKGTATYADVANEIAIRRRFWLGDAFASGGANGYDHKKEGITARGTWECVRRHFREMGRDPDHDDITVIGIGDMSGDVFGNGLLLSRRFRLRAAFNHQHIFLDPTPDPLRSHAERQRLFRMARSAWTDYDPAAFGEGGGVFPRAAKRIALNPAAAAMLELNEEASGEEIVRAILRVEADLLWNGGIGTYVKASTESHTAVGDSANDGVRVDADELRVAVVGEGGNLGFTQRARVEYALRGGRINTDAIDNSAGVDMSDHEVNLKTAFANAVDSGQLSASERHELLAALTGEVTGRVLSHNARQARILSYDQTRSQAHLVEFRELMSQLRATGTWDRLLETLPDRETLRNRRSIMLGLARPELALLLAHTKLQLQHLLLDSHLPDEPFFERYLRGYFPDTVNQRFGPAVRSHRLRREIIAVETANTLIDSMGCTFVTRTIRETGADPVSVVRAWAIVAAVSGAEELGSEIERAGAGIQPNAEFACWTALVAGVERATKWVLATQPADGTTNLAQQLSVPISELLPNIARVLPEAARTKFDDAVEELAGAGVPRPLAGRILLLQRLIELFEIARVAADSGLSRPVAAEAYYRVGMLVDLDWVRESLASLPAEDRWERRAVAGLTEGLMYARRHLTLDVLRSEASGVPVQGCLETYAETEAQQLGKLSNLINDIKSAPRPTLAGLLVVMRELGRLLGRRE